MTDREIELPDGWMGGRGLMTRSPDKGDELKEGFIFSFFSLKLESFDHEIWEIWDILKENLKNLHF